MSVLECGILAPDQDVKTAPEKFFAVKVYKPREWGEDPERDVAYIFEETRSRLSEMRSFEGLPDRYVGACRRALSCLLDGLRQASEREGPDPDGDGQEIIGSFE